MCWASTPPPRSAASAPPRPARICSAWTRRSSPLALGIAGTQAAGLKSMFGTMCKPLHAGKAAYHGLLAAKLASRGFTSRADVLECPQGFARTHSPDFHPERALENPPGGWYIRQQSLQVPRRLLHDARADRGRAQAARTAWLTPAQVERITPAARRSLRPRLQHSAATHRAGGEVLAAADHGDGRWPAWIPAGWPPIRKPTTADPDAGRAARQGANSISATARRTRWPSWNCG